MSDARPITNVTDFVCGTCWNSFSRKDPGVEQAGRLVCPHCGHALAAELASDPLAAVRNAPANADSDSGMYVEPHSGEDEDLPMGAGKPLGWAPHENVARSAEPAGFVVGAPDEDFEDFDFNEATLRPDVSHDGLLAAVRATAETPDSGRAAAPRLDMGAAGISAGHVVGDDDEFGSDTAEPTPADFAELDTGAEDAEARDWKLKAIGLTYNFHGLDALIGWASNKAGQSMQISMDGQNWKDFDSFFTAYRAGVPAAKAFADALAPGATQAAAAAAGGGRPVSAKLAPEAPVLTKASAKPEPGRGKGTSAQMAKPDTVALGSKGGASAAKNLAPNRGGSRRVPVAAAQNTSEGSSKTVRIVAIVVAAVVVVGVVAWKVLAK
ncbi:MAG: hypothetical protein HY902_18240 [Deltaproteobacteria bacterium]|nr:hypothetical protein [Deltaproteobacteria bacterium]